MQNIQLTGQNIEITPPLRDFIEKKFQRLSKHTERITSIHIVLQVNKLQQIAEAKLHVPGNEVHAQAESENMYSAIDSLVDKVVRQLERYKQKLSTH